MWPVMTLSQAINTTNNLMMIDEWQLKLFNLQGPQGKKQFWKILG